METQAAMLLTVKYLAANLSLPDLGVPGPKVQQIARRIVAFAREILEYEEDIGILMWDDGLIVDFSSPRHG